MIGRLFLKDLTQKQKKPRKSKGYRYIFLQIVIEIIKFSFLNSNILKVHIFLKMQNSCHKITPTGLEPIIVLSITT